MQPTQCKNFRRTKPFWQWHWNCPKEAQQLAALENSLVKQLPPVQERIANLTRLKGVGEVGAMRLILELFWRDFGNRRQVGSCVGLVPQPYDSGESRVDQGISK